MRDFFNPKSASYFLLFFLILSFCKNKGNDEAEIMIDHDIVGRWGCNSVQICGVDGSNSCDEVVEFGADGTYYSDGDQYGTYSISGNEYILCTFSNVCDPVPFVINGDNLTITVGGENCIESRYLRVE